MVVGEKGVVRGGSVVSHHTLHVARKPSGEITNADSNMNLRNEISVIQRHRKQF